MKDELLKKFLNKSKLQSSYDRLQCICSDLVEAITVGLRKKKIIDFINHWNYLIYHND